MFEQLPTVHAYPDQEFPGSAANCLNDLDYARFVENTACHRKICAAVAVWEHRVGDAGDAGADAVIASNDAIAEIAVRLHCSNTSARTLVETGALLTRLPIVADTAARGDIDYANLRMLTSVLGEDACPETLLRIDQQLATTAATCTPSTVRAQAWRLWQQADPDEAAAAKKRRAKSERCAYVRRGGHGLSWLTACLTDVEGYEADILLAEIIATVCSNDPRSRGALRADGLMALLHGEAALMCGCGQSDCPKRGQTAPARRAPLVQIIVDADTLLGLADNPAALADGTPIDAGVARALAENATWQSIITEARTTVQSDAHDGITSDTTGIDDTTTDRQPNANIATSRTSHEDDLTEGTTPTSRADAIISAPTKFDLTSPDADNCDASRDTASDRDAALAAALADIAKCFGTTSTAPQPPCATGQRQLLHRGRTHRAGVVLQRPACSGRVRGFPTAAAEIAEQWEDAIARDPRLGDGPHPDGHGGLSSPPPGALTYQPRAEVAALVRATYPTCAFPDCTVAARRCELDHVVEFDQGDPASGGWTIPSNLQPLCKLHHDLKTQRYWHCTTLAGGAHYWRHHSGLERITLPDNGFTLSTDSGTAESSGTSLGLAPTPSYTDVPSPEESLDLLYEPTWWERHMHADDHPGNDADLIAHYRQHQAIVRRRKQLQPAPF